MMTRNTSRRRNAVRFAGPAGNRKGLRRSGVLSMELVMTLPILMIVLMALFEFSLLFFSRSQLVESCRAGARVATLSGATPEAVEQEVRRVLDPRLQRGLQLYCGGGQHSGDLVTVVLRVPMNAAAPDLLWPCGFSLAGRELIAQTNMIKE